MPASAAPDVICIGSVLWDTIGRSPAPMKSGDDVPGDITRVPGGVAMNVAMALRRLGLKPTLLSAIGWDAAGEELLAVCLRLGIGRDCFYRSPDLPTDRYMAIEDSRGLIAAIADARSLEAAGDKILLPLRDGRLGSVEQPWSGLVVLDGNLTEELMAQIASSPLLAAADLRVVPASPGKGARLRPLLNHPSVTFYVNLEEAGTICGVVFSNAVSAVQGLLERGARRALVTDGERLSADGQADGAILTDLPPAVRVQRVTGAGDVFMAAHIAAEQRGEARAEALVSANRAGAEFVAGATGAQ